MIAGRTVTAGPGVLPGAPGAPEDTAWPGAWVARAACRREGSTALFFAEDEIGVAAARQVCRRCPVCTDCAAYALALPDLVGIWGGLTEAERRRRRRRRALPGGTVGHPDLFARQYV